MAAVRAGLDGRLDPPVLARLAPAVAPRLRVLTGLSRAARWSELRPAGLEAVLGRRAPLVDVVVVDLAPPLEEDEELSYDTAAPRRNGAALDVLRAADDVLVVGSADPVGLQRLVRGLQDLSPSPVRRAGRSSSTGSAPTPSGRNPRLRVHRGARALRRGPGAHLVPDDRPATDRALLAGRTLAEHAPDSPARAALRDPGRGAAAPGAGRRRRRGPPAGRGGRGGAAPGYRRVTRAPGWVASARCPTA